MKGVTSGLARMPLTVQPPVSNCDDVCVWGVGGGGGGAERDGVEGKENWLGREVCMCI